MHLVSSNARKLFAAALLGLLMLVSSGSAFSTTPTTAVPATLFGDHLIDKSTGWFKVPTGALGKATEVGWPYIEKTKGTRNWSNLDAWVAFAQSNGQKLFYSPEYVPVWAASDSTTCKQTYSGSGVYGCSSTVANIADWDNFVTALVQRYKGKMIWELWNEPTSDFTGTYAQFVQLTQHFHDAIRAYDPGAIIVNPSYQCSAASYPEYAGCTGRDLDGYWAAGGTRDVDAVSFHGYPHHNNPVPEGVVTTIGTYFAVMGKYGVNKPLWDTEASWGDSSYPCCQSGTAAQMQSFIARHYLLHWSAGATRYYWYAYDTGSVGTLWNPSSGLNAGGHAYAEIRKWMVEATMTKACSTDSAGTWSCPLTRSGGYIGLAIWNPTTTVSYKPSNVYIQYRTMTDSVVQIPTGTSVNVSSVPILLENTSIGGTPTNYAPTAVLTVTPTSGTVPVTVSADSSASYDPDGSIASRSIAFGDGTTVSGQTTASHTYSTAGNYGVTLSVTDNKGLTSTATKAVAVKGTPTAVMSVTPQTGSVSLIVDVDSSGSYETNGTIASRTINFGDGSAAVTTATATHTYSTTGTFTVTLTVKDASGTTAKTTKAVTVSPVSCAGGSTALTVTICGPKYGSTSTTSVNVSAVANDSVAVVQTVVYVDGVAKYTVASKNVNATISVPAGSHTLKIAGTDSKGVTFSASEPFTTK